jgi:hypothetical protein
LFLMASGYTSAQEFAGLWGSSLYRVELKVDGTNVTGTFTLAQDTHSPTGTISGQLRHDRRSFTATWTMPTGVDNWNCSTWLGFAARDGLLTGYRWSDETEPAAFALHRAIDGQVPVLTGPDGDGDGDAGAGQTGAVIRPVQGVEIILCEDALDGQPRNITNRFVAPKTVTALVRHTDLPAGTPVEWSWSRDGKPGSKVAKTLSGTGWNTHGLASETALNPGRYHVTVSVNRQIVADRDFTVSQTVDEATTVTSKVSPHPPSATNDTRSEFQRWKDNDLKQFQEWKQQQDRR